MSWHGNGMYILVRANIISFQSTISMTPHLRHDVNQTMLRRAGLPGCGRGGSCVLIVTWF